MRYQISTWSSDTATEASAYTTRKRLDAAQQALWSAIYDMCAADGALDTERAHRLLREWLAFCNEPHPLNGRHYFARDFVLRSNSAGKCEHVRFVAIREDR